MKLFHISDVLSATTGRLVSFRHMDGIYEIYNFLTGDDLFTHQLPRAFKECQPWLRTQFPLLMGDSPSMSERLAALAETIALANGDRGRIDDVCRAWVELIRQDFKLPEMIPVYEMDMHTHIDPIEEAEAMVGKGCVIKIEI